MSLVVVTTAGASNANAYAEPAAAVTAAGFRVGGSVFAEDLSDDQRAQALVTFASMLDALPWKGERASSTQSMEFPRTGAGMPSGIPHWLVKANIEGAIGLAPTLVALDEGEDPSDVDDVVNPTTSRIKSLDVGSVKIEYATDSRGTNSLEELVAHLPLYVRQLVLPWLYVPSQGAWGMSTAERIA